MHTLRKGLPRLVVFIMWDELPASGSWKEDIVEEREREKERRETGDGTAEEPREKKRRRRGQGEEQKKRCGKMPARLPIQPFPTRATALPHACPPPDWPAS